MHKIKATCTLRVTIITDDMLTNSITVRLENMSQERFLSPLLNLFMEGVAAVLSTRREAVFVFNIQNDTDVQGSILNVTFSAMQPGGGQGKGTFFPSEELQEQIYLNRTLLRLISSQEVTKLNMHTSVNAEKSERNPRFILLCRCCPLTTTSAFGSLAKTT